MANGKFLEERLQSPEKKEHLKKWAEDVKKGGTHYDKWIHIDTEIFERFKEARVSYEQVNLLFYRNRKINKN